MCGGGLPGLGLDPDEERIETPSLSLSLPPSPSLSLPLPQSPSLSLPLSPSPVRSLLLSPSLSLSRMVTKPPMHAQHWILLT